MKLNQTMCWLGVAALSVVSMPESRAQNPPKAVLVMQTNDPWLTVIGSDSPEFALYEDGTVIFLRESRNTEKPSVFYTTKISDDERASLLKQAAGALTSKKPRYRLVSATDQPTSTLALPPRNDHTVSIYGSPFRIRPEWRTKTDDDLPPDLLALMKRLRNFDSPTATRWLPEKVEVMFWDFSYAKGKPVAWPKGWPDLESADTRKRRDDYSVFVPSENFPKLQDMIRKLPFKSPISINGKLMAISYRFPFPDQSSIYNSFMQEPPRRTKPYKPYRQF